MITRLLSPAPLDQKYNNPIRSKGDGITHRDNKRKVVLVAYAIGRVGSSATMGLLKLAGINMEEVSLKKTTMNPKGGFESPLLAKFLDSTFKGIYGSTAAPPPMKVVSDITRKSHEAYFKIHDKVFNKKYLIEVKSPRMLLVPYFSRSSDEFDTKVIVLQRDPILQMRSILKVWNEDPERKEITNEAYIVNYLRVWTNFLNKAKEKYDTLEYLDVDFEAVVARPYQTMKKISEFIGVECPDERPIKEWIDPTLVNRKVNTLM